MQAFLSKSNGPLPWLQGISSDRLMAWSRRHKLSCTRMATATARISHMYCLPLPMARWPSTSRMEGLALLTKVWPLRKGDQTRSFAGGPCFAALPTSLASLGIAFNKHGAKEKCSHEADAQQVEGRGLYGSP